MLFSKKRFISLFVSAVCVSPVFASGYHFGTQSVSEQSTANASSAEASDASTLFYNPAGISKLEGTNISVNANLVAPNVKYKNAKAFLPNPANPTAPVPVRGGSTSGKMTKDIVAVPHFYATHELNDAVTLGVGVYVPFASETEYQKDSVLRYNVNKTKLTSIDINPTVSFKIDDSNSLAVGVVAQHSSAELRQYANFGAAAAKLAQNPALYGNADGYADIEGDDWGFGYTLGYLVDVNDNVRLGASYRSKVEHNLKGTAKWKLTKPYQDPRLAPVGQGIQAPMPAGMGYLPNEKVNVKITTPESLSLHGMVKFNDKWTGFGDVTLTRHSRFNKVDINYQAPKAVANATGQPQPNCLPNTGCKLVASNKTTLKPHWKDTVKVGLGAAYQYNDKLQLRGGVAYDQSPVRSPDERLSTMPDNDRMWFSVGAKYDFDKNSSLNVGYSYIHIKDAKANVDGFCGGKAMGPGAKNCVSSRANGSADYKSSAHILGVQYNHKF